MLQSTDIATAPVVGSWEKLTNRTRGLPRLAPNLSEPLVPADAAEVYGHSNGFPRKLLMLLPQLPSFETAVVLRLP